MEVDGWVQVPLGMFGYFWKSVLSMSVMGFQKKFGWGVLSSIQVFLGIF